MNIQITQLTEKDLDPWAQMRLSLWPSYSKESHQGEIEEMLGSENFIAWAAWQEAEPVGFLELFVRPFANGCEQRPVPFLEGVWVKDSVRRLGVGRQLLKTAEKWSVEQGYKELGSDALIENSGSHDAHARWGFTETERVVYFRKQL